MDLNGKVAIVTGSARGIGKAIALSLAKERMNVVVNSRTQEEIDECVNILNSEGNKSIGVLADISKEEGVEKMVKTTLDNFGRIDVLVNNAGIATVKPLVETSEEEIHSIIDINLKGAFLCTKAVLPTMMKQRSGVIVNISSGAGKAGFSDLSVYCASKFGMIGLTESLAEEVDEYGIRVIAVCPGAVATRMQEGFDADYYQKNKDMMLQPEDVAERVLHAVKGKYRSGSSVDV